MTDTPSCTCCGAEGELPGADAVGSHLSRYCATCWTKRTSWDEGARSVALIMLGQAVKQALSYDAPPSAIRRALELALSEDEGLHPDDAYSLGAETVPLPTEPAVTVRLTPEMADCIAKLWREGLGNSDPASGGLHTSERVASVRVAIDTTIDRINLIKWDERRETARLTLAHSEMIQLADDLMESGATMIGGGRRVDEADNPMGRAKARREYGREVEAGMAILNQLESASRAA